MITREMLNALRGDLEAALAPIAQKYGLTLETGHATYSANRFSMKIEGVLQGSKSEEAERYEASAKWMRLPPLGSEVTVSGEKFVTKGLKSRGKNTVIIERVRDGKEFVCPVASVAIKSAPTMSLTEFTKAVNDLSRAECERLNAKPNKVFGAEHVDYPEAMLAMYHKDGKTPQETINILVASIAAEGRAEARAS